MTYDFRVPAGLLANIHADLSRSHSFAYERVGFIRCHVGKSESRSVILAESYHPIDDDDYLESRSMGAVMGSAAIRKALQRTYQHPASMFHVHRHDHRGVPSFSYVDLRESARFIPDFWKVAPQRPHGALVLSLDAATGMAWDPDDRNPKAFNRISSIGRRLVGLGRVRDD